MKTLSEKLTKGFSLIEVLVALVVLTIGLLGMAGLQGYSITGSYNAHLRTQATALAQDIIDRMRANPAEALGTSYDVDFGDAPSSGTDCIGSSATCTTAQLAAYDLREWKCNLGTYAGNSVCAAFVSQSTLPSGDGRVVTQVNGQFEVTVQWTDTAGDSHQVMLNTSL